MKRPKQQNGCIPHQVPTYVMDLETAEELSFDFVNKTYVMPFLECIREQTKTTIDADKQNIIDKIKNEDKIKQPTGLAWKHGIRPDLSNVKKNNVLATSRIEKIIQHRIVSELQSYINNPNPKKQEPTFEALKANLGAADKQISTVEYDSGLNKIFLTWKCWTRELLFIFDIPNFAKNYTISKICLPSVYYNEQRSRIEYDFPFVEELDYSQNEFHHCYGAYDAGRVEPYRLCFKNNKGAIIAEYRASGRCRALNSKRERILENVKCIHEKLACYDALGIPEDNPKRLRLLEEKKNLKAKVKAEGKALARLIGWEISRHCQRHQAAVVGAENLSWVSEKHGSSRWNYSEQQLWVARECQRVGTVFMNVSARDSSQTCCECDSKKIVHDSASRLISCKNCGAIVDRDVSAARVLARRCLKNYRKYMDKVALSHLRMRC